MDKKLEKKIQKVAEKYLKKGRPGWDLPHTKAVVYFMKELIKREGGDSKILITAAWLHDIGYAGLFEKNKYNYSGVKNVKPEHMKKGAIYSKKILNSFKEFFPKEIKEICHLVSIHDKKTKKKTQNEQLIFEADSLGQIDCKKTTTTFDGKNYKKFINNFEKDRLPYFQTKYGETMAKKLFKKLKNNI